MDNRELQKRRRKRRQEIIKMRKRKRIRRIALLVASLFLLVLLIFFIIKLFAKAEDGPGQKDPDDGEIILSLENEEEEEEKPEKKAPISTEITPGMKKKNLDKKINNLIKAKDLKEEDLAVGYFNMASDESYAYNDKAMFRVGRANDFILAMDVYDLAEEKYVDLDEEIILDEKEGKDGNARLTGRFSLRQLIKMTIEQGNEQARAILIDFVEERSSKNWYDELSNRYGLDISYKNEMSAKDSMQALRRLFSEDRKSAKDRIEEDEDQDKYRYQELINFMVARPSDNSLILRLKNNSQVSENYGEIYENAGLMGFVLGDKQYLYVILTRDAKKQPLYEALSLIEDWHVYYNN